MRCTEVGCGTIAAAAGDHTGILSEMNRRLIASATLVLSGLSAGSQQPIAVSEPHGPLRIMSVHPDGSVVSPNWSGYAVTGLAGSVTSVYGSWTVPQATCGAEFNNSGASHWVGIDGYTSSTVEQTGTDSDCSTGSPRYYAWYELYPQPGTTIKNFAIQAGDVMSASVVYSGTDFVLTIADERTQQTFTTSASVPGARRNSAEWIAEDNSINFSDFGTVYFGQDQTRVAGTCSAAVDSTSAMPIGVYPALQLHAITMADASGNTMALPSALSSDGTSFSVQWQSGH